MDEHHGRDYLFINLLVPASTTIPSCMEHSDHSSWHVIEDLADVTGAALEDQIKRLEASPVAWAAEGLQAGSYTLKAGVIRTNGFLGNQKTIFGNLDGIWAAKEFDSGKFLVKQVRGVLHDPNCTDNDSLERMKWIENSLSEGSITPNITLLRSQTDMIIDGNKTAAAFHHLQDGKDEITLKVFLVITK